MAPTVERYRRSARWLHALGYTGVLLLLFTGVWLLIGREGDPSPVSDVTGLTDTQLHVWVGWGLAGLAGAWLVFGLRGLAGFVLESVRFRRDDLAWFRGWPRALVTGRFPRHDGRFDPGQRLANLALLACLTAVIGSGVAMAWLHGGPAFVWLVPIHRWSTYALLPLVGGHVAIAAGVLPGYRGVWRSMHLGGRLPESVARRLWPAWHERYVEERDRRVR